MPLLLVLFGLCWFHLRPQYRIFSLSLPSQHFLLISLSRLSTWSEPRFSTVFMPITLLRGFSLPPIFFPLFPIQSSTFSSLEVSDLSRCYWATWFSLQTLLFLTTWNSSPLLCKKKKIFDPHGQGELQDKNMHTPKEVTPECVVPLCYSFQFCMKHFLLFNRANTYIKQKTLYLLSIYIYAEPSIGLN